jgi:hypothetical protein
LRLRRELARNAGCGTSDKRNELPPSHEHLPRKRTLALTAVKDDPTRYAIEPHFSFRFLPLPPHLFGRFIGLRAFTFGGSSDLPEGC